MRLRRMRSRRRTFAETDNNFTKTKASPEVEAKLRRCRMRSQTAELPETSDKTLEKSDTALTRGQRRKPLISWIDPKVYNEIDDLYSCFKCSKQLWTIGALKNHILTHFYPMIFAMLQSSPPFQCNVCDYKTSDRTSMARHLAFIHKVGALDCHAGVYILYL